MQATTLTFVIVASQVGLATGHISSATSAALHAGLLSAPRAGLDETSWRHPGCSEGLFDRG
jgi:hypothetical protein